MEQAIYVIREYHLGKTVLKTWELGSGFTEKDLKRHFGPFKLSLKQEGEKYRPDGLLDFYATVKEDVPSRYLPMAKTYKRCQLMMEKHGTYIQFKHLDSGAVLRIAMNSHYFTPEN